MWLVLFIVACQYGNAFWKKPEKPWVSISLVDTDSAKHYQRYIFVPHFSMKTIKFTVLTPSDDI